MSKLSVFISAIVFRDHIHFMVEKELIVLHGDSAFVYMYVSNATRMHTFPVGVALLVRVLPVKGKHALYD